MIAGGAGIASGSRGATWQWLASLGAALSAVGSIGSAPGDVLLEFSNKHEGLVPSGELT